MSGRLPGPARGLAPDLLAAAVVLLGNPVLLHFGAGIVALNSPDAAAYGSLARVMAGDGLLYLRSWGHVDQGVILPPLLPALIALASRLSGDLLWLGAQISGLAALLAGLAWYLLLSRLSNRVLAVAAVLAAQLGRDYYFFAFAPLTESLFGALTAWILVALLGCARGDRVGRCVALGVGCALLVLSRKAGVFVATGCLAWLVLSPWWDGRASFRRVVGRPAALIAGALLLLGPYAGVLYAQTGQHPLQPRFRLGEYTVGTQDPAVIAEIARIRDATGESGYSGVWHSRRLMRKLLPDGSEMYAALEPAPGAVDTHASVPGQVLAGIAARPGAIFGRLSANAGHLREALGWPLFGLFLAASFSPLLQRAREPIPSGRLLLPAVVWIYLLGVSGVTGLVARYVVVIAPLAVLQCASEVWALASRAGARPSLAGAAGVSLVAIGVALMPRHFSGVELESDYAAWTAPYAELRRQLPPGAPVFAPAPLDALLLGADYRILPNADLARVVRYARATGVRWIATVDLPHNRQQLSTYEEPWFALPRRQRDAYVSAWLEKRADVGRGRYVLYRIRGVWPEPRDGRPQSASEPAPGSG